MSNYFINTKNIFNSIDSYIEKRDSFEENLRTLEGSDTFRYDLESGIFSVCCGEKHEMSFETAIIGTLQQGDLWEWGCGNLQCNKKMLGFVEKFKDIDIDDTENDNNDNNIIKKIFTNPCLKIEEPESILIILSVLVDRFNAITTSSFEYNGDIVYFLILNKLEEKPLGFFNDTRGVIEKSKQIMTPDNSQWGGFCNILESSQCCDFHLDEMGKFVWKCNGDFSNATKVLKRMPYISIEGSLNYFKEHGANCDCSNNIRI